MIVSAYFPSLCPFSIIAMFLHAAFVSLLTLVKDMSHRLIGRKQTHTCELMWKSINFRAETAECRPDHNAEGMSGEEMVGFRCGGMGSVKERDADVDNVIAKVRQEIEAKAEVSGISSKLTLLNIFQYCILLTISSTLHFITYFLISG